MTIEVSMPQMGESIAEGTLVKWHKKLGERVERDETLFEISTDKVDTEIPSPAAGHIARILVNEGETVPVNTVVCWIDAAAPVEAGSRPAADLKKEEAVRQSSGPQPAEETKRDGKAQERTSPLVRRLAAEHGVDLKAVSGTGPGGRVTKDDIFRQIEAEKTPVAHRAPGFRIEPTSRASDEDWFEPMSNMRQRIADHMVLSSRTSVHVTTLFEVDMTAVRELKESLSVQFEERHQTHLTYMPFVIQAVSRALRKYPALNASVEGKTIHYHGKVNIGIAVALESGLVVPVIRDADKKDILSLARDLNDLALRARSKALDPLEVQAGTFTITNPGVFGSVLGTPIIHQPQVGILCIGAIQKRPVVLPGTDAIAVRSMMYLSLTFDHRLVDGAMADYFVADIKATLESGSFEGIFGL